MGWMKYVLAIFLSLSLLSVSMVRSQNDDDDECPINTTGLAAACRSLYDGVNSSSCCSLLQGLSRNQAGICIYNDFFRFKYNPKKLEYGYLVDRVIGTTVKACGLTNA
ncbi:hypothetical protein V8G54_006248 [Vigna mungo]|uniref:Bifunctional inhibitor/plant lipid transfer protein/seed storage helical domain-containing protein n=1 Tax=Vigna mungo TaxID=3915 RepID=A0AAQ3NYN0_VIGMU